MKLAIKFVLHLIFVLVLTIGTQIGGLVYLVSIFVRNFVLKKNLLKLNKRFLFIIIYILTYLFFSFIIVPPVAKSLGRTPLPVFSNENIKPLNIMTCVLNRHYVTPKLKESIINSAEEFNGLHPNSVVSYLDANFPFFDGFPLAPHLSHNDGKKLDLAFFYKDQNKKELNNSAPSLIGYGVFEEPKAEEYNMPKNCEEKGFWQYGIIERFVPQWNKDKMIFDLQRTKDLIHILSKNKSISKIFIEPHLKTRMKLNNEKIRFHGCRAVRHDDHIHLQIN